MKKGCQNVASPERIPICFKTFCSIKNIVQKTVVITTLFVTKDFAVKSNLLL